MIVLDASIAVQILLADDAGLALTERLAASGEPAAVPHLLDVEVASAFRALVRSRSATPAQAALAIANLASLRMARHSHETLLMRMWELRDALTAYDAVYVALAEALDAELWTRDARLAKARGPRCRITVL